MVTGTEIEAHELKLFADNDSQTYHSRIEPIQKNLAQKKYRGVYNHDKAVKLFGYAAAHASRRYDNPNSDGFSGPMNPAFGPEARKMAAEEMTKEFETEFALGNFSRYKQKYVKQRELKNTTRHNRKRRGLSERLLRGY